MKKRLTYFLFVLSMFILNQSFCSNIDGSNSYYKELDAFKEKNPKIKMELENWSNDIKQQSHKIDLIKQNFYSENDSISKWGKFSNFLNNLFLGIDSYTALYSSIPTFYLDQSDVPNIFNQIYRFSNKSNIYIDKVKIKLNHNSNELIEWEERLVYSHTECFGDYYIHYYNSFLDLILTRKCFEDFTKDEFDISLAKVFSNLKNKNEPVVIAVGAVGVVTVQAFFMLGSLILLEISHDDFMPIFLATFWSSVFLVEFSFLLKKIKEHYKNIDLDALELLDNPKQYLDYILPFSQKELKKQYLSILNRIKNELQEKYPERAKLLKQDAFKSYLQKTGNLNKRNKFIRALQRNFWPFPTQEERIGYVKNKLNELGNNAA